MKNLSTLSLSIVLVLSVSACGGNSSTTQETNASRPIQSNTQESTTQETTQSPSPAQIDTQPKPITTTPDTNTTPTSSKITPAQQAALNVHNEARTEVDISNMLTWSDTIAADAQSYADTLAQSGMFAHDPKNYTSYANGPYGENLYASFPLKPSLKEATQAWVDEKSFYHYGAIGDTSTCDTAKICGHYTQIIWKNTTEVGCATSQYMTGSYKDGYVIVCKYKTPGNYRGQKPY